MKITRISCRRGRLAAGRSELTVPDELVLNDPGGPMPDRLSACHRPGLASLCGHACRVAAGVFPAFSVAKDRARYVGLLLEAGDRDHYVDRESFALYTSVCFPRPR
jgi:hypothetical protein